MKATEAEKSETQVTESVEKIIRKRLETLDEDRKTASPWPEVKRRILQRSTQL